jgi:hypothetical protein
MLHASVEMVDNHRCAQTESLVSVLFDYIGGDDSLDISLDGRQRIGSAMSFVVVCRQRRRARLAALCMCAHKQGTRKHSLHHAIWLAHRLLAVGKKAT